MHSANNPSTSNIYGRVKRRSTTHSRKDASNAAAKNTDESEAATVKAEVSTTAKAETSGTLNAAATTKPSTSGGKSRASKRKDSKSKKRKATTAATATADPIDFSLASLEANINFDELRGFVNLHYPAYITSSQFLQDLHEPDTINLDEIMGFSEMNLEVVHPEEKIQ